jgi:hypothetical protein
MPKHKAVSKQQRKAIKTYVKQGLTSNKIQKRLQKQHLGLRRKVLLAEIRKVKRKKPKANALNYTPKKYRRAVSGKYGYPSLARRQFFLGRQIAGYGTVLGKSRRIQVYGSGKQLHRVMLLASQHPPRARFLTIDAGKLLSNPWKYLSRTEFWDARPRVDS